MEWRELTVEELYGLKNPLIIDVRSPGEFQEARIPGSINVALLNDDERVVLGTIYKQQGEQIARRYALKIISPKIPLLIDEILAKKEHSRSIVIHCWRGGLRSEAVSSVLSIAGIASYRLTGGYKAWRNMVLHELDSDRFAFEPIVLYGMTGSGKTDLLHELSKLGYQVLDLEQLASHRGSIFGGIGLGSQPSQKNFEALLWECLRNLDLRKPVFIEAESRKIGKVSLPDTVLKRIKEGQAIFVEAGVSQRVKRITRQYLNSCTSIKDGIDESLKLLELIKQSIGKAQLERIHQLSAESNIDEIVRILLEEYYDPLYAKSMRNANTILTVCDDNENSAIEQIKKFANSFKITDQPLIRSSLT